MQTVIPVYIAIDSSYSMQLHLDDVENAIARLREELLLNPVLGDRVRIAIVAFSDRAELVLPLTDLTLSPRIPGLRARGSTRWGPLFDLLSKVVIRDLDLLKSEGTLPGRPHVFMLSDALPTDDWQSSFSKFVAATRPRFSYIGLGSSAEAGALLEQVSPARVFTVDAEDSLEDAQAIAWPLISSLRPLVGSYLATRDPDSGVLKPSRTFDPWHQPGRY
jgi:uncharacterized protein YegL